MTRLLYVKIWKFIAIALLSLWFFGVISCVGMRNESSIEPGCEIYAIWPPIIKRFQYHYDTFLFDAIRISENSKIFTIKTINKKTGAAINCFQSGDKFKILLERFSIAKAVKKIHINSDDSVQDLGIIIIEDYSVLEPVESHFVKKENSVILKLSKNRRTEKEEFYIVDIPESAFKELQEYFKDHQGERRSE